MATTGIFLSHSSQDNALAYEFARRLREQGYETFLGFQGIPGGAQWEAEIYRAMRGSVAMVLCATPHAIESRWVFAEIVLARFCGRPVIPVILQPCVLPDFLATTQFVDVASDPATGYARLWEALKLHGAEATARDWPSEQPPYPGLAAMQEEHADVFFGREQETEMILEALRVRGRRPRCMVLLGASGSGKSSLLRAGIVPRLRRGAVEGSSRWTYVRAMTPGSAPFRNLAASLRATDATLGPVVEIEKRLRGEKGLLYAALDLVRAEGAEVVLPIDQLEELTRLSAREEAQAFLEKLHEAVSSADSPVIVLGTLRTEFVARCLEIPAARPLVATALHALGAMDRVALRRVIVGPAMRAGFDFEDGLVDEILDSTGHGDALPMLAFVLGESWSAMRTHGKSTVTRAIYRATGGVEDALRREAQRAYDATPADDRPALMAGLEELADVDDRGEFTRRRVLVRSLPTDSSRCLERFVDARLLVVSGEVDNPEITVAHEAMLRVWPTLRQMLDSRSGTLQVRRDLHRDAAAWARSGRSPAYLWRGDRLAAGRAATKTQADASQELSREFLDAADRIEQRDRERESELLARRVLTEIDTDPERSVLLVVAGIEEYAWTPRAEFALNTALDASRKEARLSLPGSVRDVALSPDGRHLAAASDDWVATLWQFGPYDLRFVLTGHSAWINRLAFASGGKLLVTASDDCTVRIWDVATGSPLRILTDHRGWVVDLAVSFDGETIATASADATTRVWNVKSGECIASYSGMRAGVRSVCFSADGTHLAFGMDDGSIQARDLRRGASVLEENGHSGAVNVVAFAPNGHLLLSASDDGFVKLWGIEDETARHALGKHNSVVNDASWSPDGSRVVTAAGTDACVWETSSRALTWAHTEQDDEMRTARFNPDGSSVLIATRSGMVRLLDARDGSVRARLFGPKDWIRRVAFAPDARRAVAASDDSSVHVWDAAVERARVVVGGTGAQPRLVREIFRRRVASISRNAGFQIRNASDGASVGSVPVAVNHINAGEHVFTPAALSQDESLAAVGNAEGEVGIWSVDTGESVARLVGHGAGVTSIGFDGLGERLVTSSLDNTARLWDLHDGERSVILEGHRSWVSSARMSPDSHLVLTVSGDRTARIWDGHSGSLIQELDAGDDAILQGSFSQDGLSYLTASRDGHVRIYDTSSNEMTANLRVGDGYVRQAAFSPDGARVVTLSYIGDLLAWDAGSGQLLWSGISLGRTICSVAIEPYGKRLAAGRRDGTVAVGDVGSGQLCQTLTGHRGAVFGVAWSENGGSLVSVANDGTMRIWRTVTGAALLETAKSRMSRSLRPAERQEFGLPAAD